MVSVSVLDSSFSFPHEWVVPLQHYSAVEDTPSRKTNRRQGRQPSQSARIYSNASCDEVCIRRAEHKLLIGVQ